MRKGATNVEPSEKASFFLISVFLILLISMVWSGNGPYGVKLKASLALIISVGMMIGTVLAVQRWNRSRALAYVAGLAVFAVGYIASCYLLFGEVDVATIMASLIVGLLLILLGRWEENRATAHGR
ncbi:hypothetical protein [Thermococcus stetteri]|uniref:hypothetical protein n=1 Tax=Thermococcus stetteri TaxID=49900 RepID=UPI001AE45AED|nr:hypothetical protein [Thermococcus stetteri]MBP1912719.1 NADH:ubiquinone oxidoreductase subunit 2 (subunit N) [Thermococcus stetteri]